MLALQLLREAREAAEERRSAALTRMERAATAALDGGRQMTRAETTEVDTLRSLIDGLGEELDAMDEREAELAQIDAARVERAKRPSLNYSGAPREGGSAGGPAYERARQNIDHASRSGHLPGHAAEKATALIENGPPRERSIAAQWIATAGDPHYRTCFAKLLSDPTRGHLLWTAEEAASYRAVAAVHAEMRAMDTTSGTGAELIPLTLDPAIMLTNAGSNNPLRRLARVARATTNTWQGVTSAGVSSEWKSESAQAADATPTLAAPSIPIFLGDSYIPYSYEVGMDAENFLQELTAVLVDSADQLQATAFTTGNGTTAPQGIVTGLVGTSSDINGTGSEALDSSDPFALQASLGARFSANASFLSHIATANTYRQKETTNGALMFPELRQSPPMLCGKPWHELSNMDGSINAAKAARTAATFNAAIRRLSRPARARFLP